jgi:hypothetical protein
MSKTQAHSLVRAITLLLDEGADTISLTPANDNEQVGVTITVTGTQHFPWETRSHMVDVGIAGMETLSSHIDHKT